MIVFSIFPTLNLGEQWAPMYNQAPEAFGCGLFVVDFVERRYWICCWCVLLRCWDFCSAVFQILALFTDPFACLLLYNILCQKKPAAAVCFFLGQPASLSTFTDPEHWDSLGLCNSGTALYAATLLCDSKEAPTNPTVMQ